MVLGVHGVMRQGKHLPRIILLFLLPWLLLAVTSCSGGGGGSGGGLILASSESLYDPGASVDAVSFGDASHVQLGILDKDGQFSTVSNGQYMDPGTHTMAVKVEGGTYPVDRVFLSDGGSNQVEARKKGDLYVCDYTFNEENMLETVLVQVFHPGGFATKEKYVFRTIPFASDNELVRQGIGVIMTQEVVDGLKDDLASMLDNTFTRVFDCIKEQQPSLIDELDYGDGDPNTVDVVVNTLDIADSSTYPDAVLHVNFTIKDVSITMKLFSEDFIETHDNDLAIDLYIKIWDQGKGDNRCLVLDTLDSAQVSFVNDFFLRGLVEDALEKSITTIELPPISFQLGKLMDDLGITKDYGIDLTKYLFVDAYGIPEDTGPDALAMGSGLFLAEQDDLMWPEAGQVSTFLQLDMDDMFTGLLDDMVRGIMETTKEKYSEFIHELTYGDDNPDTRDVSVNFMQKEGGDGCTYLNFHLNFTVKAVDIEAVDLLGYGYLVSTHDNDLTIDMYIKMVDNKDGSIVISVIDDFDGDGIWDIDARFAKNFDSNIPNLQDCIDWIKGLVDGYFNELDPDIYGLKDYETKIEQLLQNPLPPEFTPGFLEKRLVEILIEYQIANMDPTTLNTMDLVPETVEPPDMSECLGLSSPVFPDVSVFQSSSPWDFTMQQGYNARIAISQYNLNQLISRLLGGGREWEVEDFLSTLMGDDFKKLIPEQKVGEKTIMYFPVPPVFDLRASKVRLIADDVILEYMVNGVAQWRVSLDVDMVVDLKVNGDNIDVFLESIPSLCHFHVMRDNTGSLGLMDHSDVVEEMIDNIPKIIDKSPGDPIFSIDLKDLEPGIVLKDVTDPVEVSSRDGYLYLDIEVEDLDLSALRDDF